MNGYETTPEFQSTPPRGWRRRTPDTSSSRTYFNPLHHEGGDTVSRTFIPEPNYFNPLHHEGGDEYPLTRNFSLTCDFNPLHHEGGDLHFRHTFQPLGPISIHSTTRVETGWRRVIYHQIKAAILFQSTPPRGWRHLESLTGQIAHYFNPLHHEGGDIRGPSRCLLRRLFQSTPPRGWRLTLSVAHPPRWNFNPLHHESGDPLPPGACIRSGHFNPLHHEGGDPIGATVTVSSPISIHSTTRVETQLRREKRIKVFQFQSTPPRGWRRVISRFFLIRIFISIHSTTRVETHSPGPQPTVFPYFNPLHHEGGDFLPGRVCFLHWPISIHSTTRVETHQTY